MSDNRWTRLDALYHLAAVLPLAERLAFLDRECVDDPELRRELESLLEQPTSGGLLTSNVPVVLRLQPSRARNLQRTLIGERIGPYEVVSLLGVGGMGEVYRARDPRLSREVAIKVLPAALTADAARLGRFQREARLLAALNHPNIATIHGIEDAGGHPAIVMELIEGQTLAERLGTSSQKSKRTPWGRPSGGKGLPIAETLDIAKQIAGALDVAHERGIIHRDLKPANIKITPNGLVKILDFGIAKVTASGDAVVSAMTVECTEPGAIIGTAAYMSPEQARGLDVDKRTDIWAFGCLVYEMLAGCRAFGGDTMADVLGAIVEREPDWRILPPATPSHLRLLIERCLVKNPKARLRDIGDAGTELEEVSDVGLPQRSRLRVALRWGGPIFAITISTVALATLLRVYRQGPMSLAEVRLEIATPPTSDPGSMSLSPDGQTIAFVASLDGHPRLWLRSLASVAARPLGGTDNALLPFWSPDSRSIGFFADRRLKKVDLDTGGIQVLAYAEGGRGGAWNRDGIIIFQASPSKGEPLLKISSNGGTPSVVESTLQFANPGFASVRLPQFLPDGRRFLFFNPGPVEARGVYLGSLDGQRSERLVDADTGPVLAAGHLLFVRQTVLFAQPFDVTRAVLEGEPAVIADHVAVNGPIFSAAVTASVTGPIAYHGGLAAGRRQIVWFDRSGRVVASVGDAVDSLQSPSLSPDGRRIAAHGFLHLRDRDSANIWLLDLSRGVFSPFATLSVSHPLWSPDGNQLAFALGADLYRQAANGTGSSELLVKSQDAAWPSDWSDTGVLLFTKQDPRTRRDIYALRLSDSDAPHPIVRTSADEEDAQLSRDGRLIAYQSDKSGRFEIYVQRFPELDSETQVSVNGGAQVRWRRDGRELYYVSLDGNLMAVPIKSGSGGQAVDAGAPTQLFVARVGDVLPANSRQQYVPSPDGERFLMNTVTEEAGTPIVVVLNWQARTRTK